MEDEPSASLTIDLSGITGAWVYAYLALPEAVHTEARRAVALNLLCDSEGRIPDDWEKRAPKILAFLKGEAHRDNVVPFPKPKLSVDNERPRYPSPRLLRRRGRQNLSLRQNGFHRPSPL